MPAVSSAVVDGGGEVVGSDDQPEAVVWTDSRDADGLRAVLAKWPSIGWVQLPFAGVDRFLDLLDHDRIWTSTKGAYSEAVAEHAVGLTLAGLRLLPMRARARSWGEEAGRRLAGARVTVLGGGGITEEYLRLLQPFRVTSTVLRRDPSRPVPGAGSVVGPSKLHDALEGADIVMLALALTPETAGIIGAAELAVMEPHAWLVNVARGRHVVTTDLVTALRERSIGGAALDVTDPEPLPDGHPLWDLDNCLITPHVSNTWEMALPKFAERVCENVARYAAAQPLLGVVDPDLGY